jgi:isoquinoline 1-oxidoreductase
MTPRDVDAWLSIGADGIVTLATGKVEFGQGIQTGFAQLAAEELDLPFERITVVMGQTNRVPRDSSTVGSQSTRSTGPLVRQAAAELRQWLLELGAQRLGAPIEQLSTRDGAVLLTSDPSKAVTYAELAAGKPVGREFGAQTKLKSPKDYTIVGKRIPRVDVPAKVTGEMTYGYDAMLPGMAHGKILRPPSLGARLESVDTSAAERMPGVVGVVRDGDFVGLAADRVEQAQAALAAIRATWRETPSEYTSENIHDALKATKDQGRVMREVGDVAQALGAATKRVDAVFTAPYIAHAPIEPMTALVHVQPEQTEVWVSTQNPFGVQDSVARALGLSAEQVIVYPLMSGGAFGRKAITDDAPIEAARLSKAFNRPVRVNWTRQEDFQLGRFRPALRIEVAAGLNERGELAAWRYDLYAAAYYPPGASSPRQAGANVGANALEFYAGIPNAKTTFYQGVAPLPPHFWRANGGPVNTFAREAVVDELAELAGADPVSFRRRLLAANPRLLAVMEAAVAKAGWQPTVGPSGKGFGLGLGFVNGSYVAEVAQVAVDRTTGKVTVKHVDVALDCGLVVNPAAVESQVEGAVVMHGTSSTLKEQITFANGRVTNATFAQYAPITFSEAPSVAVVLVEDRSQPMAGVGEPAVEPCTAAIANAIYDAVGARLRDLPFTPARALAALQAKR